MPGLGDLCASPESPRQLKYVLVVAVAHQPVSGEREGRGAELHQQDAAWQKRCV